jgi:hypothetical protein
LRGRGFEKIEHKDPARSHNQKVRIHALKITDREGLGAKALFIHGNTGADGEGSLGDEVPVHVIKVEKSGSGVQKSNVGNPPGKNPEEIPSRSIGKDLFPGWAGGSEEGIYAGDRPRREPKIAVLEPESEKVIELAEDKPSLRAKIAEREKIAGKDHLRTDDQWIYPCGHRVEAQFLSGLSFYENRKEGFSRCDDTQGRDGFEIEVHLSCCGEGMLWGSICCPEPSPIPDRTGKEGSCCGHNPREKIKILEWGSSEILGKRPGDGSPASIEGDDPLIPCGDKPSLAFGIHLKAGGEIREDKGKALLPEALGSLSSRKTANKFIRIHFIPLQPNAGAQTVDRVRGISRL